MVACSSGIIGIGVDLLEIERISKVLSAHATRFLQRVFTNNEIARYNSISTGERIAYLAKRFAAKEAIAKAMGTGFGAHGIAMKDIEIYSDDSGKPCARLHGAALHYVNNALQCKQVRVHLSISDTATLVTAFCVLERAPQ